MKSARFRGCAGPEALVLVALLFSLVACRRQEVLVHVKGGRPDLSAWLLVQPYKDGEPALNIETFEGQPSELWFDFGNVRRAEVGIHAEGIDAEGAVVTRGEARAQLVADGVTELTLELETLPTPLRNCADSEWCWETPTVPLQSFHAVFGLANKVWTVGTHGTILYSTDEGASFHAQESGTKETLRGIWGKQVHGEDRLWAVGMNGTILKYKGGGWESALGPVQDETYHQLRARQWYGIWGEDADAERFWIVGDTGSAARYDHGKWRFFPSTTTHCDATAGLYSIWGTGDENVWAVGGKYSKDGEQQCLNFSRVIIHWNGKEWSPVGDKTMPPAVPHPLRQVIGLPGVSPAEVWAIGGYHECNDASTAAAVQLGSSVTPLPMPPNTPSLFGIWPDADGSLWLAGGNASKGQAAVYRRPKPGMPFVALQLPSGHPGILRGIWGTKEWVIAVGDFGNILRIQKTTMSVQTTFGKRQTGDITSMWAASPQDVWAVGAGAPDNTGFALHWDGQSWTEMAAGQAPLFGVRGSRPNRVWMVGGTESRGSLLLWNGSTLQECMLPRLIESQLLGVWTLPTLGSEAATGCSELSDDLWFVGGPESGTKPGFFVNKRGRDWPAMAHPFLANNKWTLYSAWGSDHHTTWIVGGSRDENGGPVVIICNDGDCHTDSESPFPSPWPWLLSVWGTGPDNLYVSAGNVALPKGNVYHRSARGWALDANETPTELQSDGMQGIAGTGPNDIYAVGGTFMPNRILQGGMAGFIQHRTYEGWETKQTVTTHHLRCVTSAGLGNVWIGGAGRTILRKRLPIPERGLRQ